VLVLTRKVNQSIVIGGTVVVRVLQVGRDQVRLGIEAPTDVLVHREEVFQALEAANRTAAATTPERLQDLVVQLPGLRAEEGP
jgi:carbon storage regulator